MTETLTSRQVTFDLVRLPRLRAELERLNKIAAKLNVEPIVVTEVSRDVRHEPPAWWVGQAELGGMLGPCPKELWVDVTTVTVEITGDSPKLSDDWTFVGAIEHAEAGNILHGEDPALADYLHAEPNCDHCHVARLRNKTVVLRGEGGQLVQVGSTCLKDFLGYHGNPERVVDFIDDIGRSISEGCFGARLTPSHHIINFLTAVAATVRTHGWVPKSAYKGTPTVTIVEVVLGDYYPKGRDGEELRKLAAEVKIIEADVREAVAVRNWGQAIEDASDNYLLNLRTVLSAEEIVAKHYGIAASAVAAKAKAEGKIAEREVEAGRRAASEWVGVVGERLVFEITVKFVRAFDNDYGTTYLVTCSDQDGNTVKTFSSGAFGRQAKTGDRYTVKGTVKEHGEFNGSKETLLSRVAVIEQHNAEPEVELACGDPAKHANWACTCPKEA